MEFTLKADAVFEAIDIRDAFLKIGRHFIALARSEAEISNIYLEGNIKIEEKEGWTREQIDRLLGMGCK